MTAPAVIAFAVTVEQFDALAQALDEAEDSPYGVSAFEQEAIARQRAAIATARAPFDLARAENRERLGAEGDASKQAKRDAIDAATAAEIAAARLVTADKREAVVRVLADVQILLAARRVSLAGSPGDAIVITRDAGSKDASRRAGPSASLAGEISRSVWRSERSAYPDDCSLASDRVERVHGTSDGWDESHVIASMPLAELGKALPYSLTSLRASEHLRELGRMSGLRVLLVEGDSSYAFEAKSA